jgi:hypothetical protein
MKTDNNHKYFICRHCRKRTIKNPRIKAQHYCGSPECQQSRKNSWEKKKLREDPNYREQRKLQKSNYRNRHKTDGYQSHYRSNHPHYRENNRKLQHKRNTGLRKIVKTDAIISELLNSRGFQMETMRKKAEQEKIVKTDTLIAVIKVYQRLQTEQVQKTG